MKTHLVVYHYLKTKLLRRRYQRSIERNGEASGSHESGHSQSLRHDAKKERLRRWQEKRIVRHVAKVRKLSPFYRKLWAGEADENWRSFPIVDKAMMMDHFDELNTVGISRDQAFEEARLAEETRDFKPKLKGVTVGLSSGTSGNRGLFVVDDREQAAWSGTVLAKMLPGGLMKPEKIAFFLRANSNLYESVNRGRLQFRYFDLLEPPERLISRLEDYRPSIWIAPASMLRLLAEAKQKGALTAVPGKIISVAEVLDPIDRRSIEESFGQVVHQAYQCTEGFLAYTCERGTLHLNEDLVAIEKEYLDPGTRRFVPIITDFSRISQPIIRYRLNDILTEAEAPCPCGLAFTAIERIEGRCDDILYLPHAENGQSIAVFPDFVSRTIIGASPDIEHYRVVQTGERQWDVAVALREGEASDEALHAVITYEIMALCEKLRCLSPELRFISYDFVPGPVKLRRVERRWKP